MQDEREADHDDHREEATSRGGFLRWQWDRLRRTLPPDPRPEELPPAEPDIAYPGTIALRATWIGQASFLLQLGGLNVLTDPQWSKRASPVQWAGPERFTPPGVPFAALPPIHAVILSHDHYDHLDESTVQRLHERYGDGIQWITPPGYLPWLGKRGIERVTQLAWWDEATLADLTVTCAPAQHWSRRGPFDGQERGWASFALRHPEGGSVYFGGDSGWFDGYTEIGQRLGPFDLVALPIGAYAPRWFMKAAHMDPEEAVQAYCALGGTGVLVGMHWGTFRLSDEDPLEPPRRTRAAWKERDLPEDRLWLPKHGETRTLVRVEESG